MARRVQRDELSEKDKVLHDVFYDSKTGFQNAARTLVAARQVDPSIKIAHVKEFFSKQAVKQDEPRAVKGNSYVAHEPREEFQLDLTDFGPRQFPRYGLVAVDIFTKKLEIVSVPSKKPGDTADGLDRIVHSMDVPATIMTDQGGEWQGAFSERLKYYDIEHTLTRTHPRFVERAIRTLKEAIRKRQRALDVSSWIEVSKDVVEQYNSNPNSVTGLKPNVAAKDYGDDLERAQVRDAVHTSLKNEAAPLIKNPALKEGDAVRLRRKADINEKGPSHAFVKKVDTVEKIDRSKDGPPQYDLERYKEHPVLRHELLKVGGYELPDIGRENEDKLDHLQRNQRAELKAEADEVQRSMSTSPSVSLNTVAKRMAAFKMLPKLRRMKLKVTQFLRLFKDKFALEDGGTRVRALSGAAPQHDPEPAQLPPPPRGSVRKPEVRYVMDAFGRLIARED